jgi:hemerythrin superfamily protein
MTSQGNFTTGARADAVELLTSDHRAVEQLFSQLQHTTAADTDLRRDLSQRIVHELSVHAAAEEQELYPLLRKAIADGVDLAEHSLDEHQEIKEHLKTVDGMAPDDDRFLPEFRALEQTVSHHVEEEEGEVLPKFKASVSGEKLYEVGDELAKAKAAAPTHPHPHAPNTPPGNVVAGAVASVVDKARDALHRD